MKAFVSTRQGDELFHGVAEVPTSTVSDEKDLVIKVEAAQINVNASDTGSAGRLARYCGDVFAASEVASIVTDRFPQSLASTFTADGHKQPVGREGMGVIVAAGCALEAQSLLMKRVAVALEQPQQSNVRSAARRRASVFVDHLRCLVSFTKQEGRRVIVHTATISQVGRML